MYTCRRQPQKSLSLNHLIQQRTPLAQQGRGYSGRKLVIHILYQAADALHPKDNHEARARALAAVIPGATVGAINPNPHANDFVKPGHVGGLETLVFWGHGTLSSNCGMSADAMVKYIAKWKKNNSKLKTVEFITCNARHADGKLEPYINMIKAGLKAGFMASTRDIVVKALPVNYAGSAKAYSILLAEANTKSWVYITAPADDKGGDTYMTDAEHLIKFETDPSGKEVPYRGDISLRANQIAKEFPIRKWTVNYGPFNTLRNSLVVV